MKIMPTPADLEWREDASPVSRAYGDVYFSKSDGQAETRHVFIDGNALTERFQHCKKPVFTIGETGFGTGLNLLVAWQCWAALPEPKPDLHFITLDLHPLPLEALERAQAAWPELSEFAQALRLAYPPLWPGKHRRYLADGRITVDFLWGEAREMLTAYQPAASEGRVDAWFLDGFSPAKNPAMWQEALYTQLARLSEADATLATFTSAGHVRRGLGDAGFAMRKVAGHAHKREMSVGTFTAATPAVMRSKEAIVIGGGIAGIASAWQLVRAGRQVRLIEAENRLCSKASANPVSAVTPYFTADWSQRGRIYASAFAHTTHLWQWLAARGHAITGAQCGSLVLSDPALPRARQQERHGRLHLPHDVMREVGAQEASAIAGLPLQSGGFFYPQGGWLEMARLCDALIAEMGDALTLQTATPIHRIMYENSQWCAYSADAAYVSDTLVLACAHQAAQLLPSLELQPVRGQLISLPEHALPAPLQTVLHFGEYLTPAVNGQMVLGSSFGNGDAQDDIRATETAALLESLGRIFPDIDAAALTTSAKPWAGIRCATRQRQPLIGPAEGQPAGLYLSLAHGSRGMLTGLFPFATRNF